MDRKIVIQSITVVTALLGVFCERVAAKRFPPEEGFQLFEGDILIPKDRISKRAAVSRESLLWPNGVVVYEMDPSYSEEEKRLILEAMAEYENTTCVRFEERSNETNYLEIKRRSGCGSTVGYFRAIRKAFLGAGCLDHGTILHELGHVLGFFHQHRRPDRDDYILIHRENIKAGQEYNFRKLRKSEHRSLGPFDLDSIMMYGEYTFSKDKNLLKTMTCRSGCSLKKPSQKGRLSDWDVVKIRKLYKCDRLEESENRKK